MVPHVSSREILFAILLICINESCGYNLTVRTQSGYVRGFMTRSSSNSSLFFYGFRSVPYAKAPLGNLRFQDPQPPDSWDGVRLANFTANSCVQQTGNAGSTVIGNEDCLNLNIYVPQSDQNNEDLSFPVMISVHGGAFVRGSPYGNPSFLLEKPVIVVVIAYRLGVLGFLNIGDQNAWGNAGLKDQSLAIQWVKNNIRNFGGDPNKITIFGQSAGGASISYHLASPKSRGLFAQAIVQSGTTLSEWGFMRNPTALAFRLARLLNIGSNDTAEVVRQLQRIDYQVLVNASSQLSRFLPSVEVNHPGAFINRSSYDIWTNGDFDKVPVIIGHTSEDGAYGRGAYRQYAQNPRNLIPAGLNVDLNSPEANQLIQNISDFYFPDRVYDNLNRSLNFMTQHYFVRGIRKIIADLLKTSQPLYYYRFSYVTTENYTTGVYGAGHGEENLYTWYTRLANQEDILMKDRLITMWTNFAIYGNPTPSADPVLGNVIWPSARGLGGDNVRYLEIGRQLVPGTNPAQQDFLFWRNIFQQHAKPPIYTY